MSIIFATILGTIPFSSPFDIPHRHTASCGHVVENEAIYTQLAVAAENVPNAWDFNKPVQIDVAVWFPPKWRELVGENEVDARIERLMEWANRSLGNSHVNAKFNVVFAREMAWEEKDWLGQVTQSTLFSQSLDEYPVNWTRSYSKYTDWDIEGRDGVRQFSYQTYMYGADIVLWIQEDNTDSGYNVYGDARLSPSFANPSRARVYDQAYPYSLNRNLPQGGPEIFEYRTRNTGVVIAHELGHTLGLHHHRAYFTPSELYAIDNAPMWNKAYSSYCGFGEHERSQNVMHGGLSLLMQNQLLFSSPNYDLNGQTCSNVHSEDQAGTLNEWIPFLNQIGKGPEITGNVSFSSSVFTSYNGELHAHVVRSGDLGSSAEVEVNAFNGSAIAGVHYNGAKQVVTFAPGQSTATAVFSIVDATADDGFFNLRLQYPHGLAIEQAFAIATTTPHDHTEDWRGDFTIPTSIDLTDREIRKFPIVRSGDVSKPAVVYVSTEDGSAIAGQDYQSFNRAVYFAPGETVKEVDIYGYPSNSDVNFYINLTSKMNAGFINGRTTVAKLSGVRGQVGFSDTLTGYSHKSITTRGDSQPNPKYKDFAPCQGGYLHGQFDPSGEPNQWLFVEMPSNRSFDKQHNCSYNYTFDVSYQQSQEITLDVERRHGSRGDITFTVRPIGWKDDKDITYDADGNQIDTSNNGNFGAEIFEHGDQTFTLADGETSMSVNYKITDSGMDALRSYAQRLRSGDAPSNDMRLGFIAFDEHDVNYYRSPEHRGMRLPEAIHIYFRSVEPAAVNPPPQPPVAPNPPARPEPEKKKGSSTNFGFLLMLALLVTVSRKLRKY